MSRTREEILNQIVIMKGPHDYEYSHGDVLDAMDQYMRESCMELLEYMAEKKVICHSDEQGAYFNTRGETLTKEQLFENFL